MKSCKVSVSDKLVPQRFPKALDLVSVCGCGRLLTYAKSSRRRSSSNSSSRATPCTFVADQSGSRATAQTRRCPCAAPPSPTTTSALVISAPDAPGSRSFAPPLAARLLQYATHLSFRDSQPRKRASRSRMRLVPHSGCSRLSASTAWPHRVTRAWFACRRHESLCPRPELGHSRAI